jgi:hypothetical protein
MVMASVWVVGDELRVEFTAWERLAVRRDGLVVPLSAVRKAERVDKPLAHTRGGRIGVLISGVLKAGVWGIGTGVRQLVSVQRQVPALRVVLDRGHYGGRFDELLISTANADELVGAIAVRVAK